jgi:hypothetical protein
VLPSGREVRGAVLDVVKALLAENDRDAVLELVAKLVADNVTVGDGGYQFHRNHRCPGAHPLARGRFFALAAGRCMTRRSSGARWRPRPGTGLPGESGGSGQRFALR